MLTYLEYHNQSMAAKDVDPSVICLNYLAERYELNMEQRYWLAFLYGTCYCAPTVFYIYNEFPDFETVDVPRLEFWWNENKHKLIFQTDRQRIKSNNQFVECFISYKALIKTTQQAYFTSNNWTEIYAKIEKIKYFGRFSLFNYLDVLNGITDVTIKPPYLNMKEAESCRNGVAFSMERRDLVDKNLNKDELILLHREFIRLLNLDIGNVFQLETTLCAYKKYRLSKRYVGFYIERMRKEIVKMQEDIREGIYWEVLWQFRQETFDVKYLKEHE